MTSEIRANTLKNRVGLGTISFTNTGPVVSGIITATGADINGDLDVDGHTNLDNVSIVGVTTFNGLSTNDVIRVRSADSNGNCVVNILSEGTTGNSRILFSDTAATSGDGWISYSHNDRYLSFTTAGTGNERLRITSGGHVNIGGGYNTTTHKFRVQGHSMFDGNLTFGGTLGGSGFSVNSGNVIIPAFIAHDGDPDTKFGFPTADTFSVETNGDPRFRITSAGDVGVGNNSPNCKLAITDTATHTAYAGITPSVGSCMMQLYNNPSSEAVNNHSTLQFGVNGGSQNRVNTISAVAESASNRKMAFTFCTDSGSNRNERMRITGDGKVGINEDSPTRALSIDGDMNLASGSKIESYSSGGNLQIQGGSTYPGGHIKMYGGSGDDMITFNTSGAGVSSLERLRITSTGRIEIGTGTPVFSSAPMEFKVSSSSGWGGYPEHISLVDQKAYNASDNGGGIVFSGKFNSGGSATTFGGIHCKKENTTDGHYGGSLHFLTRIHGGANDERLRITSDGKIGISSTTPNQILDVSGSINGGTVSKPFQRFHDSTGGQREAKHYFRVVKNTSQGNTTVFDLITIDVNQNFHQAICKVFYGSRLQAISDSTTNVSEIHFGINRFNGGGINFTRHVINQQNNPANHGDINLIQTVSGTQYRVRATFSSSVAGSSFMAGYVELIGVGNGSDGQFYSLNFEHGLTK